MLEAYGYYEGEELLGIMATRNEGGHVALFFVDGSSLTVYIRRLRMKIEEDPGNPQRLVTVRGMGYKWNNLPQEAHV